MTESLEIAIFAYRNRLYRDAMEYLLQAIAIDELNWLSHLYLAITFEKLGQFVDAERVWELIVADCKDPELRYKALTALPRIEARKRGRFLFEGEQMSNSGRN